MNFSEILDHLNADHKVKRSSWRKKYLQMLWKDDMLNHIGWGIYLIKEDGTEQYWQPLQEDILESDWETL